MAIDPRRLAAIRIQLDAVAHELRNDDEAREAVDRAQEALRRTHETLERRELYMQVPDDYKPPKGTRSCRDRDD
jgi:hypothetical protein